MINILFIAYEFPPNNSGGTQRPLKFAKYLRDWGVNPVVLTLPEESYPLVYKKYHVDRKTLDELPNEIEIIRIPSKSLLHRYKSQFKNFLSIYFRILGPEAKAWKGNLFERLPEIIEKHKPAALFVTAPPFSIISLAISVSEKYNLPLILDMRDAWSQWCIHPYGSYLHYLLTQKYEQFFLTKASAIITTSDQTLKDFQKLYPQISPNKYHLITNGYDENISDWAINYNFKIKEKIVIGYAGSFYYIPEVRRQIFTPWWKKRFNRMIQYIPRKEDWLYRSPYFFFKALKSLFVNEPELKRKIIVRFAGDTPDWITEMVEENGLQDNIEFLGKIDLEQSMRFQKSCDALLITSSKVVGGEDYSIAGKTFEYFSMKKPIISFVTAGAQKRILEKSGYALICDPDNIAEAVEHLTHLLKNEIQFSPNITFLNSLHRKRLTGKLADIIYKRI
ncbi:MAG: glycosyltransferase [Chitinophagaceae bacterium]|nr:glycosyltransferase [Chitinophagaceae bacterium]